jgi:hypothetical protein
MTGNWRMGDRGRHPVSFLKAPVAEADVRFGAHYGLNSDIEPGPKCADSVEKLFFG